MRFAILALAAMRLTAATIPCPGFTYEHLTISNCQSTVTVSSTSWLPMPPASLSLNPVALFTDELTLATGGWAELEANSDEGQSIEEMLTADFVMDPQWKLAGISGFFEANTDASALSAWGAVSFAGTSCVHSGPPYFGGYTLYVSCVPPAPLQSGTLSLDLRLRADKICATCLPESGLIDGGTLYLTQVFVPDTIPGFAAIATPAPEPATLVLGVIALATVIGGKKWHKHPSSTNTKQPYTAPLSRATRIIS